MEYLTIALSIIAVLTVVYYYYLKNLNVFKRYGIPHIPPQPIVGNMGPVMKLECTMADLIKKIYNLDPEAKYVGFYDFSTPMLYIRDLDLLKVISTKSFDHFQDHRPFFDTKIDTLFGGALFFDNGENWKNQRSMVTPVFTSSKIKNMFNLMNDCAVRFTDHLSSLPEKQRDMEMKSLLSKYSNDVIASCAFGIEVDSIKNPNNELYVNGRKTILFVGLWQFLKLMIYRNAPFFTRLLHLRFLKKKLADFYKNLILETVRTREEKGIYRPDMLQFMIDTKNKNESGKTFTISNLISNAFGFYFGAFDTVSTQLSFVFHLLAEHPNIQAKLQEEVDKVFEENNGQLTYEAAMKMEYLDAVINESMRLYPVAIFLDRLCNKAFELPPAVPGAKPFTLQVGMNVWFPVYAIHTDPKYYENPYKFDPERFVTDGKRIMNSGAFIPFGIGPRMCIGNRFALIKMKVLICHVLSRCEVKIGPKTKVPLELIKGTFALQSKDGIWLKIEPRKNVSSNANGV